MRGVVRLPRWIRARRLFAGTGMPPIHHEAPINRANVTRDAHEDERAQRPGLSVRRQPPNAHCTRHPTPGERPESGARTPQPRTHTPNARVANRDKPAQRRHDSSRQQRRKESEGRTMDDADDVLSALRLGWAVAEMRGRNRPDGPPGEVVGMPDHVDHPLPLRIERGKTELRIEIQSVVAELARKLQVDDAPDGTAFSDALGNQAKLLAHVRAAKAADALRQAYDLLRKDQHAKDDALQMLTVGLAAQRAVVARRRQALEAVQFAQATQHAVQLEQASCAGEEAGAAALEQVISLVRQDELEAITAVAARQQELAAAGRQPWADLAELLWQFDAHAQDRLAALSEGAAIGY